MLPYPSQAEQISDSTHLGQGPCPANPSAPSETPVPRQIGHVAAPAAAREPAQPWDVLVSVSILSSFPSAPVAELGGMPLAVPVIMAQRNPLVSLHNLVV